MNPEQKQIWIDALRSKDYEQARGSFIDPGYMGAPTAHCCLAVLTHEAAKRGIVGLRWIDDNPQEVCLWDPEEQEWKQASDPGEAQRWMLEKKEINPASFDTGEEGWGWKSVQDMTEGDLPAVVVGWAGLDSSNPEFGGNHAIDWNDTVEANFEKIAEEIEEHL